MRWMCAYTLLVSLSGVASAQSEPSLPVPPSPVSIHFQATSIGQTHGEFYSPYEGANSLPAHREDFVSLTSTLFLTIRAGAHLEFVVNPEIAGGKGFGNVTGIAGFTNGEIPRVAAATPALYLARGYAKASWALGPEEQVMGSGADLSPRTRAARRTTTVVGKFGLTDFFDNNTYSHDPRTQFMNWSIMYNGAWDYPADVRGYTVGAMQELIIGAWTWRVATALEPTVANGPKLDWRVTKNRGVVAEVEHRHQIGGQAGAIRLLGFENREHAGTFREALAVAGIPSLDASRRNGVAKYGLGVNIEQAVTRDIGVFGRYGWADGKSEAWAFTQIDRTISGGTVVCGRRWGRAGDHVGVAAVRNQLSGDQRAFLARGGLGFIVGDGRLNYRPESVLEAYYSWRATSLLTATVDYQRIADPAYNRDRGPVSVYSLRLHIER
jgi:high affinity Mn2+ porin